MRHYNRERRTNLFGQNLLWIGYHAWQGYLKFDRGVVAISGNLALLDGSDRDWEASNEPSLNFRYIPQLQLPFYLQEWLVPTQAIESIIPAVATYQPDTELIFALESGVNIDIGWCQRLKISPSECDRAITQQ